MPARARDWTRKSLLQDRRQQPCPLLRIGVVTLTLMPLPASAACQAATTISPLVALHAKGGGWVCVFVIAERNYLPAWVPARADSPLAAATVLSPGVAAEATVILPCSRSSA